MIQDPTDPEACVSIERVWEDMWELPKPTPPLDKSPDKLPDEPGARASGSAFQQHCENKILEFRQRARHARSNGDLERERDFLSIVDEWIGRKNLGSPRKIP